MVYISWKWSSEQLAWATWTPPLSSKWHATIHRNSWALLLCKISLLCLLGEYVTTLRESSRCSHILESAPCSPKKRLLLGWSVVLPYDRISIDKNSQTLGHFTRGREMTESQRRRWLQSMPACATSIRPYKSGIQYQRSAKSRHCRDNNETQMM